MSTYSPAPRNSKRWHALSAVIFLGFLFFTPAAYAQDNPVVSFKVPEATNFETVCIDNKDNVAGWFFDTKNNAFSTFLRDRLGMFSFIYIAGSIDVSPVGIDDNGELVGSVDYGSTDRNSGLIRSPQGSLTLFNVPGADATFPTAINGPGDIAGNVTIDNVSSAFIRFRNGQYLTFSIPGTTGTYAVGINNSGEVAGNWDDDLGNPHGFLREPSGAVIKFDVPDVIYTQAVGIDAAGDVVGQFFNSAAVFRGFVRYKSGQIETFNFPGALDTYVRAVNNHGEIVGQFDLEFGGQTYSYRRELSGAIDQVEVPGAANTQVTNLNDAGSLTGNYATASGNLFSFIWLQYPGLP